MKTKIYILIISQLLAYSTMRAQDLQQHQWKNRILVILTNDINNQEFKNQIKVLQNKTKALKERKLIIYQITPSEYTTDLSEEKKWMKRPELYQDLKTNNKSFEVILIGLDGEVKFRQYNLLSTKKLFNIIDGMPMRRVEMKNKN